MSQNAECRTRNAERKTRKKAKNLISSFIIHRSSFIILTLPHGLHPDYETEYF